MITNLENGVPGETSARAADLVYCSDAEPGISRCRAGKGFWYRDPDGRKVEDRETLQRIAGLAIPPAWTDVWISTDPDGHIQATGRDQRRRKQYRYHPRWTAHRDDVKYSTLIDFAHALPRLRQTVDADLRRHGAPYERVLASIVWLLDNAMIRVGNESYARENGSFGLTTLRDKHVDISGSTLRFAFRGKSGKEWRLRITDRRIARIVKGAQDLPGQQLFQYEDDGGLHRTVGSQDVNDYIRMAGGAEFSSRHFRTWGGTVTAARLFALAELPETKSGMARAMNEVIDRVALRLGNTRAVCRECYIHPRVTQAWAEGELARQLASVKGRMRKLPEGLDEDEAIVLRWLETPKPSGRKV